MLTDNIIFEAKNCSKDSHARILFERIKRRDFYKPVLDLVKVERDEFKYKILTENQAQHQREIAKKANLTENDVVLDCPQIKNPLYPRILSSVLFYDDEGRIEPIDLSESIIISTFPSYELTIRVYVVNERDRSAVYRSANEWAQEKGLIPKEPGRELAI